MTGILKLAGLAAAASLAFGTVAMADPAADCKASLDAPGAVPEGVDRADMEAGCDCMVDEVGDNTALIDEITSLSSMGPAERDAAMSDELKAIVGGCFPAMG
ncbi:MAG: hypothetical protein AAGL49_04100 [Pseudomonadota bacterium]